MNTDIRINGGEAIERAFKILPSRIQKRVLRAAIAAAASPVNKAAKGFAPVETRALKRSIGIKVKTYKSGAIVAVVGVRRGDKYQSFDKQGRLRIPAFYQHLVHGGTKPHPLNKGVTLRDIARGKARKVTRMHPGAKANPFLEKAWNASKAQSMAAVERVAAAKTTQEILKFVRS